MEGDTRSVVKCGECRHIHWLDEPHECPTAEYEAARDALVSAAAEYGEARGR